MSYAMQLHPRWTDHNGEFWQNVVHWRRELQTIPVFLPQELYEQYEKAKVNDTGRWAPQVGRCPIATGEEQRAITSSSGKIELGQNRNGPQLWMCLVVKVKSNAGKEQYYIESGMLGPWVKNLLWSRRRRQEWTSTSWESVH